MGNRNDQDVVYCLDPKTGEENWTFAYDCRLMPISYEGGPDSTPTVARGCVYTISRKGQVHCLGAQDGKKIWAASGLIFMHARYGLSKVSRVGDKWVENWLCKKLVYNEWDWFTFNQQIIHNGHLISLAGRGTKESDRMMCVDLETGEVKWQKPMPFGNLILAADKLITVTQWGGDCLGRA